MIGSTKESFSNFGSIWKKDAEDIAHMGTETGGSISWANILWRISTTTGSTYYRVAVFQGLAKIQYVEVWFY